MFWLCLAFCLRFFYAKVLRCWLFVLALPRLWLLLLLLTLLFISLSVIGVIERSDNGFSSFTCIYSLIICLGVPFGGGLGDLHASFEKMNTIRRK